MRPASCDGGFRQNAERQAIDNDAAASGHREQPRSARLARVASSGQGKAFAEIDEIDLPTEMAEFGNHAPVIGVAAGRGRKIARHGERETLHHKSASYQARATCDSEMRDAYAP